MKHLRWLILLPCLFVSASGQENKIGSSRALSPKEALQTFTVAPGFKIDLIACEPDVMDPVAMAFDEDGRIYVAEMADYPLGPPSGRIKLLTTNAAGVVEKATTFVDKVPYPTGVMPWRGGVLVCAAPDIWFFKDTKGDGKADVKELVFTGFVEGNQQHRLNGLTFGLDNWIYGTNGDSGGNVRRGDTDGPKVSISGRDYRFKTDYSGFEGVSGRGQYSNTFDEWGNRFINDNSNHIRHPVLPLRYLARNPNLAVSSVEEGISDHGPASVVYPTSPLQERPNDQFAAGHFTSACSVTIYKGAAFGPDFQGNAFCCEPVHNLVHRDILVEKGASFTAKRAYEASEFLSSTDNWCRPVNLCSGPDGALYVVDMYRAVIEHPQWIPLEMQKRVDLRAGWDKGRIYRVAPRAWTGGPRPGMSKESAAELVAHFEHPNAWWRQTAQRLLIERGDKSAVLPLRKLARESGSSLARIHALWTLEGLGALEAGDLYHGFLKGDEKVREQALRLAEPHLGDWPQLRRDLVALAKAETPRLRFQLALSAGYLEAPEETLGAIIEKDSEDKWTRAAVLSSVGKSPQALLARLPKSFLEKGSPGGLEFVRQLGELVGAARDEAQLVDWLRAVASPAAAPERWRLVALSSIAPSLRRAGFKLEALLARSGTAEVVGGWRSSLLETAADAGRDVPERVTSIELLAMIPPPEMAPAMEKLLSPKEAPQIQVAAVRALGTDAAAKLLDGWTRYTAPVRREVLAACLSKPATVAGIVERIEKGEIRPVELDPQQRDMLLHHPAEGVRERVKKALAPKTSDEKETLISEMWEKIQKLKGDPLAGEKVYQTTCATCHRLNGQGYDVGPTLSSVAGREKRALLTDILDPNRAIAPQYQVYLVKIPGARDPVSGIIAAETPTSITLRRANQEDTLVLRRDILEIKAWPASLMPEGVENSVSAQGFADLLEFIQRGQGR
ncbi:MAG TPA: PVC-type heme-binding CxxCH protein [Planctomycetota bacterium]|nr:PVC-type heme-binding CxxCH protein [Planctomycetota bacterium]